MAEGQHSKPSPQSIAFRTKQREEFVTERWCKGYSLRRIAREMADEKYSYLWDKHGKPITFQAVFKIAKRVEARTLERMDTQIESFKRKHTVILEHHVEDLRDAFEKSTQAQTSQKRKIIAGKTATKGKDGKPVATPTLQHDEVGSRTQVGDHSILREVRETLGDIRKIWGADAPVKTHNTMEGAMQITGQDLSALTDAELEQLRALQQKLIQAPAPQGLTVTPTPGLTVTSDPANTGGS